MFDLFNVILASLLRAARRQSLVPERLLQLMGRTLAAENKSLRYLQDLPQGPSCDECNCVALELFLDDALKPHGRVGLSCNPTHACRGDAGDCPRKD